MEPEKRYPRIDGIILPAFPEFVQDPEAKIASIKTFECRDTDVFLCTFPKSGTHWFYEIISMLLKGRADYAELPVDATFLELTSSEQCSSVTSPRIVVSHMPYKYLPLQGMRGGNRIVHVSRNPKDVAVSLYCHLKSSKEFSTDDIEGVPGEWDTFVSKIIDGSFNIYSGWCAYEKEFEIAEREKKKDCMLTFYYEETKTDPQKRTQRLAEFLHIDYDDALINDIVDKTQFSKHKTAIDNSTREDLVKELSVDGTNFMFRKGEIGDWKNWFTVRQNEKFDEMLNREMESSNVKMIFS